VAVQRVGIAASRVAKVGAVVRNRIVCVVEGVGTEDAYQQQQKTQAGVSKLERG
jgi:hypothetical protein